MSRVVFTLHPSYQPHHVIQLEHPPFQLTRRGWGEFPLKVNPVKLIGVSVNDFDQVLGT